MKKLINFYNSKSLRERIMFVAILWLLAFFWMSGISRSVSQANEQATALSSKIEVAENVIRQADKIKKSLERVKANFDPEKTISASDLQISIERCAADSGLVYSLSTTATKDLKDYKINSLTLSCRNVDLGALSKFELLLQKYEPYLYVDKVSYDANSKTLNVKYTIVSVNL